MASVARAPVRWNPDAPVFLPKAHKKVCAVISRFFRNNSTRIQDEIALGSDGASFQEVKDPDGRIWMDKKRIIFSIKFFVPFEQQPPKGYIYEHRIVNRINRLMRDMSCDIDCVELIYDHKKKRMVVEAEIFCCEG